jgi:hypothetical protein
MGNELRLRLVLLLALATCALATSQADACDYITNAQIGKAFGFPHALATHFQGPEPENNFPAIYTLCRVIVWTGNKPATPQQLAAKTKNGTVASVTIGSAEENPGSPGVEKWRNTEYAQQVDTFIEASNATAKAKKGSTFTPPKFATGADSAWGFQFSENGGGEAGGIWKDSPHSAYVKIVVAQGHHKPVRAEMEKLAATIAPAFLG